MTETREALLDGGPADGRRVPINPDTTTIEVPRDGTTHTYRRAIESLIADDWERHGTALFMWDGPDA